MAMIARAFGEASAMLNYAPGAAIIYLLVGAAFGAGVACLVQRGVQTPVQSFSRETKNH